MKRQSDLSGGTSICTLLWAGLNNFTGALWCGLFLFFVSIVVVFRFFAHPHK